MKPMRWRKHIDFKLEIKQWKKYKIIKTHFTWWMMMNRIPFFFLQNHLPNERMSCGTVCFPLNSACILACCSSSCFWFFFSLVWFSFKTNRFKYKHIHTAHHVIRNWRDFLLSWRIVLNSIRTFCNILAELIITYFLLVLRSDNDRFSIVHVSCTILQDKTRLN